MERPRLEGMSDFFAARVDTYDEHMLTEVEGCRDAYGKLAELIPADARRILDLGCGTGLELDGVFKRLSDVSVVGIDLTQAMLDRLARKYPGKDIRLVCGDFFRIDFGEDAYDAAVSFEALHHFPHEDKVGLYRRVYHALKASGVYIECDYMVTEQSVEDEIFGANARLRRELGIPAGEYCHFDTPCTVSNQIAMLKEAGFLSVEVAYQQGAATMLVAKKEQAA